MDTMLNLNAVMAWMAFGTQDYTSLEKLGSEVYNYFVHNPREILKLDNPLLIGKVFQVCLGFQEPDKDIQEVRAENAFICFSQALNSDKHNVHDEASARLMNLLMGTKKHLIGKVEQACRNEHFDSYDFFSRMDDGLPNDMPQSTDIKMLFAAYYLYDGIIYKTNVANEFVNAAERDIYEKVRRYVLENCNQLQQISHNRKIELGKIVFEKIAERLHKDIELFANRK